MKIIIIKFWKIVWKWVAVQHSRKLLQVASQASLWSTVTCSVPTRVHSLPYASTRTSLTSTTKLTRWGRKTSKFPIRQSIPLSKFRWLSTEWTKSLAPRAFFINGYWKQRKMRGKCSSMRDKKMQWQPWSDTSIERFEVTRASSSRGAPCLSLSQSKPRNPVMQKHRSD